MSYHGDGLIELGSGWWLMVGAYREPGSDPTVALVLQYDPERKLPPHGVKTLRLSPEEADEVARQLVAAVATCRGELPAFLTLRRSTVDNSESSPGELNKGPAPQENRLFGGRFGGCL